MVLKKRVVVMVEGGESDGRTFDSFSGDAIEISMLDDILKRTDNGTEGTVFEGVPIPRIESQARRDIIYRYKRRSKRPSIHSDRA